VESGWRAEFEAFSLPFEVEGLVRRHKVKRKGRSSLFSFKCRRSFPPPLSFPVAPSKQVGVRL